MALLTDENEFKFFISTCQHKVRENKSADKYFEPQINQQIKFAKQCI
jgi:hypothetical protein